MNGSDSRQPLVLARQALVLAKQPLTLTKQPLREINIIIVLNKHSLVGQF